MVVYPAEMHGESVCRLIRCSEMAAQARLENIYYIVLIKLSFSWYNKCYDKLFNL